MKCLCIHGHLYQPPREDPWLDMILPEGSAAPMRHWNERILRECYAPLAWARRMDGDGRVTDIINAYEWISFNYGPTLIRWIERADPVTYARILAGDKASVKRLGHGNALAQIYHHVIMPLATQLDKEVETAWAIADFQSRFGRMPEGMWLAETAVDTPTLEVLAAQGLAFTILAPRQARAVAPIGTDNWREVHETDLDVREPYLVELPSGRSITVFFYNGGLSLAVAFNRLLENGENFWRHLSGFFQGSASGGAPELLSLATDGETYGHHFKFGEMALAYVLAQTFSGRDELQLTNFAAFLAARPPRNKVRLVSPSSWSCAHGVERWRSDCGCTTGGGAGWNQRWRAPLRRCLDALKASIDAHYFTRGAQVFKDARQTLLDYGRVLAGSQDKDSFARAAFKPKLDKGQRRLAWKLLSMQQWALASFASCAWFFEEVSRIEPLNAMTFALRAMELAQATGGPSLDAMEKALLEEMVKAESNIPGKGNGRDLYLREVKPRQDSAASLSAQALLFLWSEDRLPACSATAGSIAWPGVRVSVSTRPDATGQECLSGELAISWALETEDERFAWNWNGDLGKDPYAGEVSVSPLDNHVLASPTTNRFRPAQLPWNKRQALAMRLIEQAEDTIWKGQENRMRAAVRQFLPFQESQTTQTLAERWIRFWPSLAWIYVQGVDIRPDPSERMDDRTRCLKDFINTTGIEHPDRMLVGRHVAELILELLKASPVPWGMIEDIVLRCEEIQLPVEWWAVQNRLWELQISSPQARTVARLIGFKV